jgi:hypothetical protein
MIHQQLGLSPLHMQVGTFTFLSLLLASGRSTAQGIWASGPPGSKTLLGLGSVAGGVVERHSGQLPLTVVCKGFNLRRIHQNKCTEKANVQLPNDMVQANRSEKKKDPISEEARKDTDQ